MCRDETSDGGMRGEIRGRPPEANVSTAAGGRGAGPATTRRTGRCDATSGQVCTPYFVERVCLSVVHVSSSVELDVLAGRTLYEFQSIPLAGHWSRNIRARQAAGPLSAVALAIGAGHSGRVRRQTHRPHRGACRRRTLGLLVPLAWREMCECCALHAWRHGYSLGPRCMVQ